MIPVTRRTCDSVASIASPRSRVYSCSIPSISSKRGDGILPVAAGRDSIGKAGPLMTNPKDEEIQKIQIADIENRDDAELNESQLDGVSGGGNNYGYDPSGGS